VFSCYDKLTAGQCLVEIAKYAINYRLGIEGQGVEVKVNTVNYLSHRICICGLRLPYLIPMGVDLHQKVGGTKSENYWFEKPSFFKPSKTSKVQILGVL